MASASAAATQDLYREFQSAGLLENYRAQTIGQVLKDIVNVSDPWSRGAINAPAGARQLTVLIINTERPVPDTLTPYAKLRLARLRNGAAAEPDGDYVLLDAAELRKWSVATTLGQQDHNSISAVAATIAFDLDKLAPLWDPRQNPVLELDSNGVDAAELFQGAVAFAIAHESHHLGQSEPSMSYTDVPPVLEGRAAELAWACPDLVHPRINELRRKEADADRHATEILAQIRMQPPGDARLQYEFGTYWLGLYMLGRTLVGIGARSDDEQVKILIQSKLDPEIAAQISIRFRQDVALNSLVSQVFHKSHPSDVDRMLNVTSALRATPHSAYRGDADREPAMERFLWELIKALTCEEARRHLQ